MPLITWGVQSAIASVPDPTYPLWAIMSRIPDDPRDWRGFVSTAGILGGCLAGLALQQRHTRFGATGPIGTRILRFAVGIVGVLLIWHGLTLILPQGTSPVAQIGRFVRHALTGIWTVFVAPMIFLRTGLAPTIGWRLRPHPGGLCGDIFHVLTEAGLWLGSWVERRYMPQAYHILQWRQT